MKSLTLKARTNRSKLLKFYELEMETVFVLEMNDDEENELLKSDDDSQDAAASQGVEEDGSSDEEEDEEEKQTKTYFNLLQTVSENRYSYDSYIQLTEIAQ